MARGLVMQQHGRHDQAQSLLDLARSAVWTAPTNLVWAFGYNAIGVALAATGRLTPIFAALAMVGIA